MIIPARNEAETIGPIVAVRAGLARSGRIESVVVVDDGSADATKEIAARHGAAVMTNDDRPGKGAWWSRRAELSSQSSEPRSRIGVLLDWSGCRLEAIWYRSTQSAPRTISSVALRD